MMYKHQILKKVAKKKFFGGAVDAVKLRCAEVVLERSHTGASAKEERRKSEPIECEKLKKNVMAQFFFVYLHF